mmetsp:Transcript_12404/g.21047  ORF Transcript_12404/g.21047 Transcript_12404/m.21047 type:complete len:89 (-) Transcript_12404:25-291(-)
MQLLSIYFIIFLFMICRGSSFFRHASAFGGGGRLRQRQQTLRLQTSSTSVAHVGDTVSKDESSTTTNLLPYFSIYYNGESIDVMLIFH